MSDFEPIYPVRENPMERIKEAIHKYNDLEMQFISDVNWLKIEHDKWKALAGELVKAAKIATSDVHDLKTWVPVLNKAIAKAREAGL